jgi:hypothetical protein
MHKGPRFEPRKLSPALALARLGWRVGGGGGRPARASASESESRSAVVAPQ